MSTDEEQQCQQLLEQLQAAAADCGASIEVCAIAALGLLIDQVDKLINCNDMRALFILRFAERKIGDRLYVGRP